jgi:hypothetical protein
MIIIIIIILCWSSSWPWSYPWQALPSARMAWALSADTSRPPSPNACTQQPP